MTQQPSTNSEEPTKSAIEKASHLKKSIEKIIGQRIKHTRLRQKRTALLQLKLEEDASLDTQSKKQAEIEHFLQESITLRQQRAARNKIQMGDFQILKVIGKGAFGEVRIVKHKTTNGIFAMKTMEKKMMISKHQMGHVVAERDIMAEADNPWLVKLFYAFQDQVYLYLVMEYCGGGDLMGLLIKKDILSEDDTRFYMAELAAAINHVHSLGFVHRDLKPDNVLISNDGHVRLSDFGLAKSFENANDRSLSNWQQYVATLRPEDLDKMKNANDGNSNNESENDNDVDNSNKNIPSEDKNKDSNHDATKKKTGDHQKLYSTVGTPDYIAIEVLYQKGYDNRVDWWSMGVIMFECLVGFAPFHANEPLATCRKIVRYERYFKIPNDIKLSKTALNLMNSLVCPAAQRLGWDKIVEHPWFKNIRWNNLQSTKPPFVPDLKSSTDSKYFEEIEDETMELTDNQKSSRYSSVGQDNRVWGYTFNRRDAQNFKNYIQAQKDKENVDNHDNKNNNSIANTTNTNTNTNTNNNNNITNSNNDKNVNK